MNYNINKTKSKIEIMLITTSNTNKIKEIVKKIETPKSNSHKGQNGKLLIIGGSSLFHAAPLWSAEIACKIVDMVHFFSTDENQQIFTNLKTRFTNGIVVNKKNLNNYIEEDDCVLVGIGMMREGKEGQYTYNLVKKLIKNFPHKKFVFDAGALQIIDKEWLTLLKEKPILTPHIKEYKKIFDLMDIKEAANKYNSIILQKNVNDYICDGNECFEVIGGNVGLTKGGTGDILAGLVASLNTKNTQLTAALIGSIILKKSADDLEKINNYWYSASDLIQQIPKTYKEILE